MLRCGARSARCQAPSAPRRPAGAAEAAPCYDGRHGEVGGGAVAMTRLEIESRRPYAEGAASGEAGPYERVAGTIHFAVDPGHPANRLIVDLDKAPRDAAGRVPFRADFCLLQPADPSRGNRRLLFEVVNRGNKLIPRNFNRAAPTASAE